MFGITGFKLMIILVAGLILIGPDKMPEIARTIGKFMRMFNEAKDNMENMIRADMFAAEESESALPEGAAAKTGAAAGGGTVASTLYDNDEDEEEEEE